MKQHDPRAPARFDPSSRQHSTEVLAHRGLSGRAPENTLAAFELAIGSGADRVELDVLLSRDGIPVVIHDDTLDRTTDGSGLVQQRSLEELRRLDAGAWFSPRFRGERVPTLDEVFILCKGRLPLNVEIKEEAVARNGERGAGDVERAVVEGLRRHGLIESTVVSSFEPLALERVRALEPRVALETLFQGHGAPPGLADLDAVRRAGSRGISISREELSARPEIVAEAHARALGLKVYTVDDPLEWQKLLDLGVDGIFSNFADDLARRVRGAPSGL